MHYADIIKNENINTVRLALQRNPFDLTLLSRFERENEHWKFLSEINGIRVDNAAKETVIAMREAIAKVSGIPFSELSFLDMDPSAAMKMIGAIRNGQPTSSLMRKLSPAAERAIEYLVGEIKARSPLIKIVLGDPGAGKSTFRNMLKESITAIDRTVAIEFVVCAESHFKAQTFVYSLIANHKLLDSVVREIRKLRSNSNAKLIGIM